MIRRPWLVAAYAGMLLGAIALFLLIRSYGESLVPPSTGSPVIKTHDAAAPGPGALFHLLLVLAAVIVVGHALGRFFAFLKQPPVIGEVVAGISLGPSLLGRAAPDASAFLLPPSVVPFLSVVAQLGVVLYMFLVGLDLNADRIRARAHATIATSHASIVAPFILGSLLALYLYPRLAPADVGFTSFALFMGVAMSITAFPVLARILSDRGMTQTELGVVALTCAAVDDVTAWCLLAFVVGVAQAALHGAAIVAALAAAFTGVMVFVVRPLIGRFVERSGDRPTRQDVALAIIGVLLSALTTELVGIHAIFGAFLFGAVIPHDSPIARALSDRSRDLVTVLLLPAFFAFAGMRTRIDLVVTAYDWLLCGLIILVATTGKFGGTFVAARATGMNLRHAAALGLLMNTRGLMELIVLNIGLDLGVISPSLFTMMVLMALATTMMATPLLDLLVPGVVRYNRPP
jgi:Kef-type K+ transport system membrane component KefB